jgi:hypothetical protein
MERLTFPTSGTVRIQVAIAVGRVQVKVRDHDSPVALHITGEKEPDQVAVDHAIDTDGSLRVSVTESRRKIAAWKLRKGLAISVDVPPQTTLVIDGAAVDLQSDGPLDCVRFTSAAGNARLAQVVGDVDVKGAAGGVTVDRVGGHLNVHLASGDVVASSVADGADVRTASGDISLGALAGDSSISSLSGDIEIASAHPGSLSVHVVSGDVGVGIAAGVGSSLDISTLSGSTRSDLEVSATPMAPDGPQLGLKVNTVSGDIRIRRATKDTAA